MVEKLDDLISEFYKANKEDIGVSIEEFRLAIKAPYLQFSKDVKEYNFTQLRIKNFGLFFPTHFRAKQTLTKLGRRYKTGIIGSDEYDIKKERLEKYIEISGEEIRELKKARLERKLNEKNI